MIDIVHTRLLAATAPSRALDCDLHEVITGQLDMQKDTTTHSRQTAREWGHMLCELGSERRDIIIPEYTKYFECALKLLPEGDCVRATYSSEKMIKAGQAMAAKVPFIEVGKAWSMSLWSVETGDRGGLTEHDTAALCCCLLAIEVRLLK